MTLIATALTTTDRLFQGRLAVEQPVDGYRFGTDAMLLAASVAAKPGQHVLELGSGVGAALFVAALRCPEASFTGIEREEAYFALLQANITANNLAPRVSAVQGDIADPACFKALGMFDHVIANPPYFQAQDKNKASALRRAARFEEADGLKTWLQAANRFLKPKGTVTFIHSADRLFALIDGMAAFCGNIKIFPFWPTASQPAKRLIVQGTKGSAAPTLILPGLVLHEEDSKQYSHTADQVIKYGQGIWE